VFGADEQGSTITRGFIVISALILDDDPGLTEPGSASSQ